MGLTLTVAPAAEPVTLAEAKAHLRIETGFTDDDTLVTSLITAARNMAERLTGRGFITQTWQYTLSSFPAYWEPPIRLPRGPVQSISSITYLDQAGATQTLDTSVYVFEQSQTSATISLAYNQCWPIPACQANAVTITFVVGYGDASADVAASAEDVRRAMLLMIGDLYRNRESQLVGGGGLSSQENRTVAALLAPFFIGDAA